MKPRLNVSILSKTNYINTFLYLVENKKQPQILYPKIIELLLSSELCVQQETIDSSGKYLRTGDVYDINNSNIILAGL